jgi:plastocyanin
MLRPIIACSVLGAVVGSVLAAGVLLARAEGSPGGVTIDNFSFTPATLTVKAGTTVTWTNKDDIPHGIGATNNAVPKSKALDTDDSYFGDSNRTDCNIVDRPSTIASQQKRFKRWAEDSAKHFIA